MVLPLQTLPALPGKVTAAGSRVGRAASPSTSAGVAASCSGRHCPPLQASQPVAVAQEAPAVSPGSVQAAEGVLLIWHTNDPPPLPVKPPVAVAEAAIALRGASCHAGHEP